MAHERILVVDEPRPANESLATLLKGAKYCVTTANGTDQALATMRDQPGIDLLLADATAHAVDSLALLDRMQEDSARTAIILLTASDDIQLVLEAFRRGAKDCLLKPCEPHDLYPAVRRALDWRSEQPISSPEVEDVVAARTERLRAAVQDLERSYDAMIEAMGDALDLRDADCEGHSRRVAAYTLALGRQMGLDEDELKVLARGAFLHDIGKIATPDSILLKPGKLAPDEVQVMREHCVHGYEMVRKIPVLREAAEIVLAHQERYDGCGYPRTLRGEEIPLGSRIFALADTLDAITSDRPYRKAATFAEAREEIARGAGKQFDPEIVKVFLGMPLELWMDLRLSITPSETTPPACTLWHPAARETMLLAG